MNNRKPATRVAAIALLTSAAVLMVGCESMSATQKGTAVGAGAGAGVGAVLGKATGGKAGTGAVVGGAIGAVFVNILFKRMKRSSSPLNSHARHGHRVPPSDTI